MRLAKRILAALCVFFYINAFAAEPGAEERLHAVKRMLVAMGVGELFMEGAKRKITEGIKTNPAFAEDFTWMLGQLTPAEAVDRIAPIYAEYVTASQAEELRTFFASPSGNKVWRMMMGRVSAGKSSLPPTLTWEERQAVDTLAASAAWRALSNSIGVINSRLEVVSTRWGEQLMQQRYAGLARELADNLEASATDKGSGGTGASPSGNANSTNPGLVRAYFALVQSFNARNTSVGNRLVAKVKEIDLSTVLKPGNLTSRDGIEDGRRKLQLYETEFSKSQREINQLNDELTASLRNLPGPDNMREMLIQRGEKGIAAAYERSMRVEENQRRMLVIMRRILALADERFGQIRLQDNRLIFDDGGDLRLYESLMQQLAAEIKIEAEIDQEQATIRENAVKKLREGAAAWIAAGSRPQDAQAQQPPPKPAQDGENHNGPVKRFYPPEAISRGEEGEAMVSFSRRPDGSIENVKLEKSSGYASLDEAALAAVRELKSIPTNARRQGNSFVMPVRFKLSESQQRAPEAKTGPTPEHIQAEIEGYIDKNAAPRGKSASARKISDVEKSDASPGGKAPSP